MRKETEPFHSDIILAFLSASSGSILNLIHYSSVSATLAMSTSPAGPEEFSSLALPQPSPDLEKHMVKSFYGCTPDSPRSFFRTPSSSPRLLRGRTNRILIYRGCFNPPHIAHLNLLRYVYLRAHLEFNIVAAIIIVLSDDSCRDKLDGTDDRLLYSLDERKKLWEQDTEFPDWACVVDGDKWDADETGIHTSLWNNVSKEGFELNLVTLIGPDYVSYAKGASTCGNREVMTSDAGRPVDFVGTNGLLQLPNCSPWKKWKTCSANESNHSEKEPLSRSRNGQKNLCQWKPGWKRSTAMLRRILGNSKEYLRGCVSGIPKVLHARRKTSHEDQDYRNSLSYLFAENISVSTSIAMPSTKERLQKQPSGENLFEATVPTKVPVTSQKTETSPENVVTSQNTYAIDVFKVCDQINHIRDCFPEIHHCRIQECSELFFIPTSEGSAYRKHTSSTEIRNLMKKNTGDPKEMTEELASVVLGPNRKIPLERAD